MRVAFVGKGGAGKSTIAGTFARLLAAEHGPVLALDSDPMPGLMWSLGLPMVDRPIPDDAVVEKADGEEGPRFRLRPGLDAEHAVELYGSATLEGAIYLQYGNLRGHVSALMRAQHAWSQIVAELPAGKWHLVGDLPGGTRQPFMRWGKYADTYLAVVEPTAKSMQTACRLARMGLPMYAVANRVESDGDASRIEAATGLSVVASVPQDDQVAAADRVGRAPLDAAPGSAFVVAVRSMVRTLTEVLGGTP